MFKKIKKLNVNISSKLFAAILWNKKQIFLSIYLIKITIKLITILSKVKNSGNEAYENSNGI